MVAIESTGTIDQQGQLTLNCPLSLRNQKVKVLILIPDLSDDEAWLTTMATNPSFDFLHDEAENIYTLADGEPLTDEK
ncbi:hypothetical protein [Spirosoma areae]